MSESASGPFSLFLIAFSTVEAREKDPLSAREKELKTQLKQQEKQSLSTRKKLAEVNKKLLELKKKGSVSIDKTQFFIPKMKTPPKTDELATPEVARFCT